MKNKPRNFVAKNAGAVNRAQIFTDRKKETRGNDVYFDECITCKAMACEACKLRRDEVDL